MDWLRLFALMVAVASVQITAEGPKKKIRIHLPQKVKHIHHHKKIYITNHPAPTQYAPAYLPSAEGAVAVPSNVGLPAVANFVPLNSVELVDDAHQRIPGLAPSASKLLPLYRARGYYGPTQSEWDDHEYDVAPPPPEPIEHAPHQYSQPSVAPIITKHTPAKRVKIFKLNEVPRKKVRKVKPKRVVYRGRPQPEEEHPVTTFHEQFYSDLEGSGTIRKVKKPPRVEKIIDGDTEHIHTYSEEHIHKLVFDDQSKVTGVVGVEPAASVSSLSAAQPLLPLKNAQTLLAIPSEPYLGLTAVGSMGTPSHLEYTAYNPRDVTHDHIFHDHGEIPHGVDITKDSLAAPPKVSYNSQGLRIYGGSPKRPKNKQTHKYYNKASKPSLQDFSYYESIYTPGHKPKKVYKPPQPQIPQYDSTSDVNYEDFKPLPAFNFKNKPSVSNYRNPASTYYGNNKQISDFRVQASAPAPFSLSSTVVHDYKPKNFLATAQQQPLGYSKFKDPFVNFKDAYANNFEYDTQASSSNLYSNQNNENSILSLQRQKGKKQKSISTLNISFGGHDHQTVVDHLEDVSSTGEALPTAFDNYDQDKSDEQPAATPYTIKASSPAHPYYSAMARQALHGGDHMSVPEASNDNFQYAEAPTPSTTAAVATTTTATPHYYKLHNDEPVTTESPTFVTDQRPKIRGERSRDSSLRVPRQRYLKEAKKGEPVLAPTLRYLGHKYTLQQSSHSERGDPQYGDKI